MKTLSVTNNHGDEEVKMKVYWNNGDVKEEEYEEVSQEEII